MRSQKSWALPQWHLISESSELLSSCWINIYYHTETWKHQAVVLFQAYMCKAIVTLWCLLPNLKYIWNALSSPLESGGSTAKNSPPNNPYNLSLKSSQDHQSSTFGGMHAMSGSSSAEAYLLERNTLSWWSFFVVFVAIRSRDLADL
jgi:hypothetical protein